MFECIFLNVFWINYVEWCYFWGNLFELGDCSGMFWKILQRTCHRLNWSETGYVVALLWRDGNGMESHKTAMEENEQTECFGMENNFFGWKFMMELTCLKWRAVFGISAMMCWVNLLTSNPGPMTVTANFPRFCGLLWSFVLGNAPHVGSTSTYQLGTTLLNGPPCCGWLGPTFNLQKAASTWVHLGPTSAQRVQLAPTGAWVTSSMAQLGPQWGPCMSVWGQVGPKLGPTRANIADSIQNPESDFFVAISNVCFLWHPHTHEVPSC